MLDALNRPLHDLRISVTDRCNFRCRYCMPREKFGANFEFVTREKLLSFEEIHRIARLTVPLGVKKLRITGGEPLLRAQLTSLIRQLSSLPVDLAMTTNGALLADRASELREAGLTRLTVSLDSVDPDVFAKVTDTQLELACVLDGIAAASAAGFKAIKLNCVVQKGINDAGILAICRRFRGTPHIVRFIEYMDVGNSNDWRRDQVVPAQQILEMIDAEFPLRPAPENYPGEVAQRYHYADGSGEIGVIASVTQPFCGSCSRARLTSEGSLVTCLFASGGHDLRAPLRSGASDEELSALISAHWTKRTDRYSELRRNTKAPRRLEMSYVGG